LNPDLISSTDDQAVLEWSSRWYDRQVVSLGPSTCRQLGLFAIPDNFRLCIIVPVFNEEATLEAVIARVSSIPIRKTIVMIDDCSTDDSRNVINRIVESSDSMTQMQAFFHEVNQGKGAALRTGLKQASGDVVIIQDADLEYDPSDYPRLIRPIVEGKADVVYGSRFLGSEAHRVLYYWHYVGNRFLTMLSNWFTNLNLTDMETCYKVFRTDLIKDIVGHLQQNRFGFEPEVTAIVAKKQYRVFEVAIGYQGRTYAEGKKIGWKDGVSAIWCILKNGLLR
jgi:glycosyltransferase involved in cell wall biosynthesis